MSKVTRAVARRLPSPIASGLRSARRWARRSGAQARATVDPASAAVPREYTLDPPLDSPVRLLIGPANFAGQGHLWATCAQRELSGVSARSVAVERPLRFPVDLEVPVPVYRSAAWGAWMERYVLEHCTHVMIEAMRPLLGIRHGDDCAGDVAFLQQNGVPTALLAHGSDVRLPSRHAALYEYSPFTDTGWEMVDRLERQAARFGAIANSFDGPRFVSTPDLMDFVDEAIWLPVVVDPQRWRTTSPVLERPVPVVVHAPSNAKLKGTEHVEPVLRQLEREGLVEYRQLSGVPPERMPGVIADSDIVLEQFVLGLYSVAACEAMAAGRVVLAHVPDRIRQRLDRPLPVVDATPDTLEQTLREVLRERERFRETAAAGVEYVTEVHDGRRSAAVLNQWLAPDPAARPGAPG